MSFLRRLLLLAGLALLLAPGARAGGGAAGTDKEGILMITLEHHWVIEVAGQRYGLIQFDTPMTTVLLGRFYVDLPVSAFVVVVPLLTVPALAALGILLHGRRRRHGFYA